MRPRHIESSRLTLIEVTPQLAQANLDDLGELARLLDADIDSTWPAEHWDSDAIRWLLNKAVERPQERGWFGWYVALKPDRMSPTTKHMLIGTCGIKGPPNEAGVIEIGYGIVSGRQRPGFATEATTALIHWASRDPRVKVITAETYPHLIPSLGVMRKLGMQFLGGGSDPGTVRYGIARDRITS